MTPFLVQLYIIEYHRLEARCSLHAAILYRHYLNNKNESEDVSCSYDDEGKETKKK